MRDEDAKCLSPLMGDNSGEILQYMVSGLHDTRPLFVFPHTEVDC